MSRCLILCITLSDTMPVNAHLITLHITFPEILWNVSASCLKFKSHVMVYNCIALVLQVNLKYQEPNRVHFFPIMVLQMDLMIAIVQCTVETILSYLFKQHLNNVNPSYNI